MQPELGLKTGQTISGVMFMEILKLNLENCRQEIAFRDGQRFLAEEVPS